MNRGRTAAAEHSEDNSPPSPQPQRRRLTKRIIESDDDIDIDKHEDTNEVRATDQIIDKTDDELTAGTEDEGEWDYCTMETKSSSGRKIKQQISH